MTDAMEAREFMQPLFTRGFRAVTNLEMVFLLTFCGGERGKGMESE